MAKTPYSRSGNVIKLPGKKSVDRDDLVQVLTLATGWLQEMFEREARAPLGSLPPESEQMPLDRVAAIRELRAIIARARR